MANGYDNWNGRDRRSPTGDYAPGESGFVRDHGDGTDTDRNGPGRKRTFGYDGGYAGTPDRRNDGDRGFLDRARDEVSSWFGDRKAGQRREADDHRGKGPRGYRRSDARILEDVNDRLSDDPALDASDIEVSIDNGEVTLSGQVTDRWEKRRAEDCADHVSGVTHVQNNLRVRVSGEGSVMTQA